MITQYSDAIFRFNITDATDDSVTLREDLEITLFIERREEDYTVTTNEFPCVVDLDTNTAYVVLSKEYFTENTTHQFQLIIRTSKGSIYRSHIDSFFVCEGI